MNTSREYQIAYVGLKPGIHTFSYNLTDSFFEQHGSPDFTNSSLQVKVSMDRKPLIFLLHFEITGTVTTTCDRCADDLELQLWDEFDTVVKIVDDEIVAQKNEDDPEVMYIGRSESILNLASLLYELSILCIPIQKIHTNDSNDESTCNKEILKYLEHKTAPTNNIVWGTLKQKNNNKK